MDAAAALKVRGVLDVLTHAHRPPMADNDQAWKDDVAPEGGSPFRPLYDDIVRFNGQPIALVLAEDWETARYAASLVHVEYQADGFVTDLQTQRAHAFVVEKPEKPRGNSAKALAAAAVRHEGEYLVPTEHHNPMELFTSTVSWELYRSPAAKFVHKLARLDVPTSVATCARPARRRASMPSRARWTNWRWRSGSTRSRLRAARCYSDQNDQGSNRPYTSKRAPRMLLRRPPKPSAGTSAIPSRARCATAAISVGWGMATGVWEALQMPARGPDRAGCERACGDCRAPPPTSAPAPTPSWRRSPPTALGTAASRTSASALPIPGPLPQAPVEGGSWMAATAGTRRRWPPPAQVRRASLLQLAKTGAASSPLAERRARTMSCLDRRQARQHAGRNPTAPSRSRTPCATARLDQHREGRDSTSSRRRQDPRPATRTRPIFAEVKVDEQLGVVRVTRVVSAVAAGRVLDTKTGRSQIMGGVVVGHRHGPARGGGATTTGLRPHHERRHRRVPRAGERRHPRHRGDLRRRAGRASSIRSASRGSARSALSAWRPPSPTRSTTPRESACAICPSRSTS